MIPILVTGGAGYIGSHTCKALRRAGFHPITYDNLARGNPESVKWGALEVGDLTDKVRLREGVCALSSCRCNPFRRARLRR